MNSGSMRCTSQVEDETERGRGVAVAPSQAYNMVIGR